MQITKIQRLDLMSCEELTQYAKVLPRVHREPVLRELAHRDYTRGSHVSQATSRNVEGRRNRDVHTDIVRHSALYDLP
jgi:hypothetical protein